MFSIGSIKKIALFLAGAAAGAFVTWRYLGEKYSERVAELEDRVDRLSKKFEEKLIESPEPIAQVREESSTAFYEKPDISTYTSQVHEYSGEGDTEMRTWRKPYIIHPDEFGELDEFDTISLMYYIDCKLADDDDNLIENVDEVVGWDSLGHFGEFDADTVYVRNERLRIDYEICRSERAYADIMEARPYLRRDNSYDDE